MNIVTETIDDLNAVIKLNVEKQDYEAPVNDALKKIRKDVTLKGFRKGKVPFGMVKKMYYKSVLVDEVNKLVGENLLAHIDKEELKIIGEPLISEKEQKPINFESDETFEFSFDVGLIPKFEVTIDENFTVPKYNIILDDALIDKQIGKYRESLGEVKTVESIEKKDTLKGHLKQIDDQGNIVEGGFGVDEASMAVDVIKDEAIKKEFIGKKIGDIVTFDLKKAFPNDTEISSLLEIEKDEVEKVTGNFQYEIIDITRFFAAEINEELFKKVFPDDEITTEDTFRAKVKEIIEKELTDVSSKRLPTDIKQKLLNDFQFELPKEFIIRWLASKDKDATPEQYEKDFPKMEKEIRWQFIYSDIVQKNELKITDEDVRKAAIEILKMQFAYYGMSGQIPDEHIEQLAMEQLQKEDMAPKFKESAIQEKVFTLIKEKASYDEKEVSLEEFEDLHKQEQEQEKETAEQVVDAVTKEEVSEEAEQENKE